MKRLMMAFALSVGAPSAAFSGDILVFAASSLKPALDPAAALWQAETGNWVVISYGGTSALARQIEQGAPADVFLSAAVTWMDALDQGGYLVEGTRINLWGNALSLIAHDQMAIPFAMDASADLASLIGGEKLAMALVDAVPVGQYGKEALIALGKWDAVAPQVVQTEDARATLSLVASGEAGYGIVYATDAKAAEALGLAMELARFPENSHAPILYPGAVVRGSDKPEAAAFLTFLQSLAANEVFAAQGFVVLAP